jgi:hypothetical protein
MSTNLIAAVGTRRTLRVASDRASQTPAVDHVICWGLGLVLILWMLSSWLNQVWLNSLIEFSIMLVSAGTMLRRAFSRGGSSLAIPVILAFLMPLVGVVQMMTDSASYKYATLLAILDWSAFAAIVYLGAELVSKRDRLAELFQVATVVGAVVTLLELYQLFALGRFHVTSTGMPLISSNLYAEFTELILPVVLFPVFRSNHKHWYSVAVASSMVATVIGAAARMGTALVLLEVILVWWFARIKSEKDVRLMSRPLLAIGSLILILCAVEGAGSLQDKFMETKPFTHRSQFIDSAVAMIRVHPIAGWGLGCFPIAYPQFEQYESEYYVNHVHNDYAEMIVDGGVVFIALWIGFVFLSLKHAVRFPWMLGCLALTIHSFSDFPLFRPQIAGLFAFLVGAGIAHDARRRRLRSMRPFSVASEFQVNTFMA